MVRGIGAAPEKKLLPSADNFVVSGGAPNLLLEFPETLLDFPEPFVEFAFLENPEVQNWSSSGPPSSRQRSECGGYGPGHR